MDNGNIKWSLSFPEWVGRTILVALFITLLGWATSLQGQVNDTKEKNLVLSTQFDFIRSSLERIETKVDKMEEKNGNHP